LSLEQKGGSPQRSRHFVVATLGIAQTLAWASSYYLPAILAGPIGAGVGVAPTWVFGAFSGALLIAAFAGPAVGRLIDRHGGRGVLVLSNVVLACGLVVLAAAHGALLLALAWAILGVGMALGLYDASFAALTALYGTGARGPITGITLLAGFASTVSWPLSTFLNDTLGWRETVLIWAALNIVIGLPLNLLLPVPAHAAHPVARSVQRKIGWKPYREMFLLAFVFAAAWFVTGAMAAHLPELLERAGATPLAAIAAAALVGPAQVAARLVEFLVLRRGHPLVSARFAARASGGDSVRGALRRRQRPADDRARHRAAGCVRTGWLRRAYRVARRAGASSTGIRAAFVRPSARRHGGIGRLRLSGTVPCRTRSAALSTGAAGTDPDLSTPRRQTKKHPGRRARGAED